MVNDTISNLIISLKNASMTGLKSVSIPYTKLQENILNVLKKEGYIEDFKDKGEGVKKTLEIKLKYVDDVPSINDVKRVSKFSKRVYVGAKDIRSVKRGYGINVVSTPTGVISGKEAKKLNVGGELLFEIW